MCIRDRIFGVDGVSALKSMLAPVLGKLDTIGKRFDEQANACLLYTSDAADDLLCVDLGGRRIIKKKNTRTIEHLVD